MKKTLTFLSNVILFTMLFLWQLPQNLIALIMIPFLGKLSIQCYRNYCLCLKGKHMSGGISLGNFAFVSEKLSEDELSVSHEVDGHTVQSKILGPLYLFVIGIPSICWVLYRRNDFYHHINYYAFYTEKWANRCAGIEAYQVNFYKYKLRKIAVI